VFVDALELPSAFLPVGRYKIQDDQVEVTVALGQEDQRTRLTVSGTLSDVDSLAEKVVSEISRTVDEL
jgi:hypothetical protein